ncbi:MAG TPA: ribonuclease [Casimicrobiaceae bacterium]|nr:ribonuclease [Casimicrobiaceae bacterium]
MCRRLAVFRARTARAALLVLCGAVLAAGSLHAREYAAERNDVEAAKLPVEARDVLDRVRAGGPFRYERDGVAFGNRERLLPDRKRGYYHEYTVTTPGVRTRGARRIVCGGPRKTPEVCYYTDDHYASFRRIRE